MDLDKISREKVLIEEYKDLRPRYRAFEKWMIFDGQRWKGHLTGKKKVNKSSIKEWLDISGKACIIYLRGHHSNYQAHRLNLAHRLQWRVMEGVKFVKWFCF